MCRKFSLKSFFHDLNLFLSFSCGFFLFQLGFDLALYHTGYHAELFHQSVDDLYAVAIRLLPLQAESRNTPAAACRHLLSANT
jgi:hypothetical protein